MRIHTSVLREDSLNRLDLPEDVRLTVLSEHGSRFLARAYEVALRGVGSRHTRRPNTGITGAKSDEYAATYDDWGYFLASLYLRDSSAVAGPYKNATDFHRQTKDAYRR
jgi:hypothetical protein